MKFLRFSSLLRRKVNLKVHLTLGVPSICPSRDKFVKFQEINGGKVVMGNNFSCKVEGIGIAKLKMEDGTEKIQINVKFFLI